MIPKFPILVTPSIRSFSPPLTLPTRIYAALWLTAQRLACVCVLWFEQWLTSWSSSNSFSQLLGFTSQTSRQSHASSHLECTHSLCVASGLQAEFSGSERTAWRPLAPVRLRVDTQRCCPLTCGPAFYTSRLSLSTTGPASAGHLATSSKVIVAMHMQCSRLESKIPNSFSDFKKSRLVLDRRREQQAEIRWLWRECEDTVRPFFSTIKERSLWVQPSVRRSSPVRIFCCTPTKTENPFVSPPPPRFPSGGSHAAHPVPSPAQMTRILDRFSHDTPEDSWPVQRFFMHQWPLHLHYCIIWDDVFLFLFSPCHASVHRGPSHRQA